MIDSTGVKIYGDGEWRAKKHGPSKRRTWKKLYLCVDEKNGQIVASTLTDNSLGDSEIFGDLLGGLEDHIFKVRVVQSL